MGKVTGLIINPEDLIPKLGGGVIDMAKKTRSAKEETKDMTAVTEDPVTIEVQEPKKRGRKKSNVSKVDFASGKSSNESSLVEPGPRGVVTNTQLIPHLKEALNDNDADRVILLKETYPEAFDSSLKYLSKKLVDKINEYTK